MNIYINYFILLKNKKMNKEKININELIDFISEDIKIDYDIINYIFDNNNDYIDNIKLIVIEVIEYIWIDNNQYYIDYKNNDFWNDQNLNWHYFCDLISERADSEVDIYNDNLWESAPIFREYSERAIEEWMIDTKNVDLIKIFQVWQYMFYNELWNNILNKCEEFFNKNNTNKNFRW